MRQFRVQPIGSQVDTATVAGATWQVWFMTSVQAGFELWQGGAGAAGTTFGVSVN